MKRTRQWFLHVGLAILPAFSSELAASPRKLTEAEAQKLALLALRPSARKLPCLRFDSYSGFSGRVGFYWFEITAEVPDNASPILAHYAVNEVTGDVWEPVQCKRVTSPEIAASQRKFVKAASLSHQEFSRLSKLAPCDP